MVCEPTDAGVDGHAIFVDTDADIRFIRRLDRDVHDARTGSQ